MQSGTYSDFIDQLQGQSQITGIFVLFGVLFFMTFGLYFIIRVRSLINRNKPKTEPQQDRLIQGFSNFLNGITKPKPTAPQASDNTTAMPDLDMLLSMPEQPTPDVPRQQGIVNIKMADGRMVEAAEMLIISRDRISDNLIVQIGELAYDGTETHIDANYQRKFIKLMRELGDIAAVLSNGDTTTPSSTQTLSFEELITKNDTPSPSLKLHTMPSPKQETLQDPIQLDLAGQIDLYLQKKLQDNPELAARGLHVRTAPDGGVQIQVDGEIVPSVGDITDPDVKGYLQETITEWQSLK
jgi:hypothetical protein